MANLIVSAVSTFDNKGLKKGQKEISAFDKSVKSLGKTFAGVFGAAALLNYGKNAIKAFAADEKAAKSLEQQLKNTGYAFSAPSVEKYIAGLQDLYGVLDDELRPAFQQLLTATGSITKSQDALNTALNVSAATGKSLTEVSAALTRGFSGNTAGLSRLGAGISKATLKTGNMDKILGELNNKFAGQAAARLDTYAGKMDQLKVASANAAETIGKSLLDALSNLSKDNTISSLSTQINDVANSVSYLITGIGELSNELQKLTKLNIPTPGGGSLLDFILRNAPVVSAYYNAGKSKQALTKPAKETPAMGRIAAQQRKLENAAIKNSVALRTAENAQLKAKTELDKLKDKFDVERIGLLAALNAATDEETKLRIRAQLAILDNNEALARKYNAELEGANAAKVLADASYQAAGALIRFGPALFNALGEMTARGKNQIAPMEDGSKTYNVPQGATNQGAQTGGGGGVPSIGVTVNAGTIVTDQQLETIIQQNVLTLLKSGNKLLPAGSL
jgi:hypothetical protein